MVDVVRGTGITTKAGRFALTSKPDRRDIRRWIRGTCATRLDLHTLVDVLSVTTELVDNAYRHTSHPLDLRIACTDFGVIIEVSDGDKDHPTDMNDASRTQGGRGIQAMVELVTS